MSCPNCDHAMQTLYHDNIVTRWWCPRCGSIKNKIVRVDANEVEETTQTPELVKRCRQFEPTLPPNTWGSVWIEMSIAESINPPETRMVRQCTGSPLEKEKSSTSPTPATSESVPQAP